MDEIAVLLGRLISETQYLSRTASSRLGEGLSNSHYRALGELQDHGPKRIGTLAQSLLVSQPAATKIVKHLKVRQWVELSQDPKDSRATLASITEAGSQALMTRTFTLVQIIGDDFKSLSENEKSVLHDAVEILAMRTQAMRSLRDS